MISIVKMEDTLLMYESYFNAIMQCISDFQINDHFCSKDYITYAKVNTFFFVSKERTTLRKTTGYGKCRMEIKFKMAAAGKMINAAKLAQNICTHFYF